MLVTLLLLFDVIFGFGVYEADMLAAKRAKRAANRRALRAPVVVLA